MNIILVYDIDQKTNEKAGQKRLRKIYSLCKRYLNPVQKSVFEGTISQGQFSKLKGEISKVIEKSIDNVVIYKLKFENAYEREIITDTKDPTSNMI